MIIMIKNKKGLSLIEIVICVALISIVTLFMYRLLSDITFQKNNEYFASTNQETRVEILSYIQSKFDNGSINNYECNDLNGTCEFYNSDTLLYIIHLFSEGDDWYFSIENDTKTLRKWKLSQITDGKIKTKELDSFIFVDVELYTNNIDNNKDNNNSLDDISFIVG